MTMPPQDFFEFREKLSTGRIPRRAPAPKADALTVTQLTAMIDGAIRGALPSSLLVRGEISNVNHHRASGHLYFTLKDAGACVDCVMWKSDVARLKFQPVDGAELLVSGHVAVYHPRGRYQLYVSSLNPIGKGALELAFQQLRAKLENEGLFAAARKRPLPNYPMRIALLTSRQTAALQDMLKVFRAFRYLQISVFHVPVQGEGSAERIADAIAAVNGGASDLIVLARGGGSLEDLWEFNEEIVARAILGSRIPVVTGIGHEVDVSIADLVADYHAHTPTEAAQIIVRHWRTAPEALDVIGARLRRELRGLLQEARSRLTAVERHDIFRRPADRIRMLRQRLDDCQRSLALGAMRRLRIAQARLDPMESRLIQRHPLNEITRRRERLEWLRLELTRALHTIRLRSVARIDSMERTLAALSPKQVLGRGYTITRLKRGGELIQSAQDAKSGDVIETTLLDGTLESTVLDQRQGRLFDS